MMRKIFIALLFMVGLVFAQHDNTINWGQKIDFGAQFENTDSLRLKSYYETDTVFVGTLYSDGLEMPGDGIEGIYHFAAYFDGVSGTSASIGVDVRFAYTFYERDEKNLKWTAWYNIYSCKKDTLYRLVISPSDSSWFQSGNFRQYRLVEADADTVLHNITDFLR